MVLLMQQNIQKNNNNNNKNKRRISSCFVSTFNRFIISTKNFFSGKRYKCKRNQKSRKSIYRQKFLVPLHPLSNINITKYFTYEPRLMAFLQGIIYLE